MVIFMDVPFKKYLRGGRHVVRYINESRTRRFHPPKERGFISLTRRTFLS